MYCSKLFEGLDRRLADKKDIDTIAQELCPYVSKGREKIIKLIKMEHGGQYLIDNADWLKYSVGHIRNHNTGNAIPKDPMLKESPERLFKPTMQTRRPTRGECTNWILTLDSIVDLLEVMNKELEPTTAGKHIWKLNALAKRTKELKMILTHGVKA